MNGIELVIAPRLLVFLGAERGAVSASRRGILYVSLRPYSPSHYLHPDQCYNAQAAVETDTMLITYLDVIQAADDKQQLMPLLEGSLTAARFLSASNVHHALSHDIEPLLAMARDAHHQPILDRFATDARAPTIDNLFEATAHSLSMQARRGPYALSEHTVEPVFAIIQHIMGCGQLSLRGLGNITGEENLVALASNIKHTHRLSVV